MNQERLYQIIKAPHISEKATYVADRNRQFVFEVDTEANKSQVKQAVEKLFKVKVDNVRVLNVKGKVKRTARGLVHKGDWKKAYVRLQEGYDINFVGAE